MTNVRTTVLALTVALMTGNAFADGDFGKPDEHHGHRLAWRRSYKQACEEARKRRRPILVKITATWCGPCRQMQQLTFQDERIQRRLQRDFVLLELDADEHAELVSEFQVQSYPTTVVVSPELTIVKKVSGYQSPENLISVLELVRTTDTADQEDDFDPVSALTVENEKIMAFGGYCLGSLLDDKKLRQGSIEFTADHRGQTISFFSEEHRRRFLANPDRYWPMNDGKCLVSSREGRTLAAGDPRVGVIWLGRLWFFTDRESQQRFILTPHYYSGS